MYFAYVFIGKILFDIKLFFNVIANILNPVNRAVSVATTQLCHGSMESATDNL